MIRAGRDRDHPHCRGTRRRSGRWAPGRVGRTLVEAADVRGDLGAVSGAAAKRWSSVSKVARVESASRPARCCPTANGLMGSRVAQSRSVGAPSRPDLGRSGREAGRTPTPARPGTALGGAAASPRCERVEVDPPEVALRTRCVTRCGARWAPGRRPRRPSTAPRGSTAGAGGPARGRRGPRSPGRTGRPPRRPTRASRSSPSPTRRGGRPPRGPRSCPGAHPGRNRTAGGSERAMSHSWCHVSWALVPTTSSVVIRPRSGWWRTAPAARAASTAVVQSPIARRSDHSAPSIGRASSRGPAPGDPCRTRRSWDGRRQGRPRPPWRRRGARPRCGGCRPRGTRTRRRSRPGRGGAPNRRTLRGPRAQRFAAPSTSAHRVGVEIDHANPHSRHGSPYCALPSRSSADRNGDGRRAHRPIACRAARRRSLDSLARLLRRPGIVVEPPARGRATAPPRGPRRGARRAPAAHQPVQRAGPRRHRRVGGPPRARPTSPLASSKRTPASWPTPGTSPSGRACAGSSWCAVTRPRRRRAGAGARRRRPRVRRVRQRRRRRHPRRRSPSSPTCAPPGRP